METEIAGARDGMIESLSFDLPETASYVLERKSVSYYPSNGNFFSPNGVKIIRFLLSSGSDWIDPSTLRLQFKFQNMDANPIQPVSSLGSIVIRRCRILAGGTQCEDIMDYNHVCAMYDRMQPTDKRLNVASEGFGVADEYITNSIATTGPNTLNVNFLSLNNSPPQIPGTAGGGNGGYKIVTIPLLSGLFNCGKMLPLQYMNGLTIELEVVNNFSDAVLQFPAIPAAGDLNRNVAGGEPVALGTNWLIQECVIKVDQVVLDSQVQEEYTQYMMQGKSIPIPFTSFVSQVQVCNGDRPTISLSRSFSRLEAVYCTFYRQMNLWYKITDGTDRGNLPNRATESTVRALHLPFREYNHYMHPQGMIYQWGNPIGTGNFQNTQVAPWNNSTGFIHQYKTDCEFQLQIGAFNIPVQPMKTSTEQYYHLLKTVNSTGFWDTYSVSITDKEYRNYSYIVAFDCKKVHGALGASLNTKMGDLITLKTANLLLQNNNAAIQWLDNGGNAQNITPQYVHFVLQYTSLLTISDSGVSVFD